MDFLFIPCTVDNLFATRRPTKCTIMFLRHLYYSVTLNIPTCVSPQGFSVRKLTKAILHKIKLATLIHSRHGVKVKQLKCRQFFVVELRKCTESGYRVFRRPLLSSE
jgi:hypothetical protein